MRLSTTILAFGLTACGGPDGGVTFSVLPDSIPLPTPSHGQFAFRSLSEKPEYLVGAARAVDAVRCQPFGSIHFLIIEETFSLGVFLGLHPDGAGDYAVERGRNGFPRPGAARVALQVYPPEQSYTMPANGGRFSVDSITGALYGSFRAHVFESAFLDSLDVEGIFNGLPIRDGDVTECRVLGEAPDSLATGS